MPVNEIELGMKIPMIESRASNIPMTKGITYVVITVRPIKIFVEYVGSNIESRFFYCLLTGEVSPSCLHSSRTHRVAHLTFIDARVVSGYSMSGNQMLYRVPDEIPDVTRSLRMVKR